MDSSRKIRKRSADEEKYHLLKKIRRLKRRIVKLPNTFNEPDDQDREEGEIESDNNIESPQDDVRFSPEDNIHDLLQEDVRHCLDDNGQPGLKDDSIQEQELDQEVLNILGNTPVPIPKKGLLQKEIAERWSEILDTGLKTEEKETITKDNPSFENVAKMVAPKLNKEVALALSEKAKKRDQLIEYRQKQISTSLACIGQALQMCVGNNFKEQKLAIIKKMNEAGKLLCDALFVESRARRKLVLTSIDKDLRDFLLETDTVDYLFGDNLTDKIKPAKAVQKSDKDLKLEEKKRPFNRRPEPADKKQSNRALNWWGPPRGAMQQRPSRHAGPAHSRSQNIKKPGNQVVPRRGRK